MPEAKAGIAVRPLDELDITAIVEIDERIGGIHRPDVWEERVMYYLRREPGGSQVAEVDGKVVGFMLGDLRAGEFGLEEPSGWIERFGIHPDHRGQDLGRRMFERMQAHFRARGATRMRTLADQRETGVAGFLAALGFTPSPLQALEIDLGRTGEATR